MVWYSHVFQNFPQFIVIHTVKGFGIVNKAEIDVFLELSCFFHDPADVGNLISGSSAFSKTSLNIREFTGDLFKKIRDIKGIFHAKMDSIKYRNGMDLTEAEDIKKRWQEYTEDLYKKDLHDPDNHDGVITHLEPDILECEVKWALESITMNKASGSDGIPVELFQILKDDAVKVLHSICQ